ncbi:hypothetical protein [Actinophytocola xinjiangensis]|nr:hypothetical protein [Actinophytocola xinjiangensis]
MPSLPEQRRVGAVLDAQSATIAASRAQLAKLAVVKRGLLADLIRI